MKILISSHRFSPEIGGIESSSATLATGFVERGHEVRLITATAATDGRDWPFAVIRQPGFGTLVDQVRWCDVFFQNNISLQNLWAALLLRRPWVVAHQTWLWPQGEAPGWTAHLKRFLLRFGTNVAISRAVEDHVGRRGVIIGNPYDERRFRELAEVRRDRDLVFLGRLVSDKGADTLLHALGELKESGQRPGLTIVGSGPEEETLRTLSAELGLDAQVVFAGPLSGEPLVRLLNAHRIMVVPSRWEEPFGIVALEGIACGCVMVGSSGGGLPDAIGPCGLSFPNGNSSALAAALRRLLANDGLTAEFRTAAAAHLAHHTTRAVVGRYLRVFSDQLR